MIVDVDVEKDAYARVFISEQKFVIPSSSFLYSNLCRHMAAHIVHPDDLQKMREFMEPSTLLERLDKAQEIVWPRCSVSVSAMAASIT